ncbi:beta-fructofuranosidase [Trichoderma asperellum]|nr:glycoside hydrolase family 32 protein [Trichoderma asperelloides]
MSLLVATIRTTPVLGPNPKKHARLSNSFAHSDNQSVGATADQECFNRWRPKYHLMPPRYWVNDPCGPGYSPSGQCYQMSFQWNPYGCEWGNMSWGHATSQDQVHWVVSREPSMQPSEVEDPCGVFTGCTWPTNPSGQNDGTITTFYTSAQHSPIHWTLPYEKGSELIRMATSRDHGRTWKRHPSAIVTGPPKGLDVLGWRDPFIGKWDSIDRCLNRNNGEYLYGVVAGGIRHQSPTVFLYSIDARNLTQWSFICTLFTPGQNFKTSKRLSDFGTNFEVTNFMTLRDNDSDSYDILLMSIEGAHEMETPSFLEIKGQVSKAQRSNKIQNWLCGQPVLTESVESQALRFEFRFGGRLDYGLYYAANSFYDTITDSRIVYGWILEEDLPLHLAKKQGWSGMLSLSRILKMRQIKNVVAACYSDLRSLDWLHCTPNLDGSYSVTTLTSSPDPRLSSLRQKELGLSSAPAANACSYSDAQITLGFLLLKARHFEAEISLSVPPTAEQVGIILYHSSDRVSRTAIYFRPNEEYLVVERDGVYTGDNETSGVNDSPETAPHTLFTTRDPVTGKEEQETLDIHIFFDVSVLEIFVNGRVVITTRIYPENGQCYGLQPFVKHFEGSIGGNEAILSRCVGWELKPSIFYET